MTAITGDSARPELARILRAAQPELGADVTWSIDDAQPHVTDYFIALSVGGRSIGRVLVDPRELADAKAREVITRKVLAAISEWRSEPPRSQENGERDRS
ncbi:MAG: hypothetical protein QOD06_1452 [Candidatus Binatota bacterium]|nr:hypothetical protein [Candidatus Binatota bacterium]